MLQWWIFERITCICLWYGAERSCIWNDLPEGEYLQRVSMPTRDTRPKYHLPHQKLWASILPEECLIKVDFFCCNFHLQGQVLHLFFETVARKHRMIPIPPSSCAIQATSHSAYCVPNIRSSTLPRGANKPLTVAKDPRIFNHCREKSWCIFKQSVLPHKFPKCE